METNIDEIESCLSNLGVELVSEIKKFGIIKNLPKNDFVIKQGQYVYFLPILLKGKIKIYSEENDLQFLLYYIQKGQSCIFSFTHMLNGTPIEISGISQENSTVLLLPIEKVKEWLLKYTTFNNLIINEYQKHYNDLLYSTKQIVCYKIEDRLLTYLKCCSQINNSNKMTIPHRIIAEDLGTSREVVSRIMKKLELDKKIMQEKRSIIIL